MTEVGVTGDSEGGSGTLPFNGFASLPTDIPTYISPFFNKAGVVDGEGRGKEVIDHTASEWRKLVTKYGQGIKVIIADFSSLTRTGGRISDSRIERMQRAIDDCEQKLEVVIGVINDNAETWYSNPGHTRS